MRILSLRHVIVAALVAGCGAADTTPTAVVRTPPIPGPTGSVGQTSCPGYVDPRHCPPFQTGGPNSISGVVTLRTATDVAPLAGTTVWGFVFMPNGNGYSMARAITDSMGAFSMTNVPNGFVVLSASGGYQPCAAAISVSSATRNADIELVSASAIRPRSATDSPVISGVVYETTPAGRQPVAGAVVTFEYTMDLVTATTVSDEHGRYSLCRLPATGAADLFAEKSGYQLSDIVVTVTGDAVNDIELKR